MLIPRFAMCFKIELDFFLYDNKLISIRNRVESHIDIKKIEIKKICSKSY